MYLPETSTRSIDVCQSHGNLLASGGTDEDIKIFDKRESKIVQTFEGILKCQIHCLRWNPRGDMIASASPDGTTLFDFKTGKVFALGTTLDEEYGCSVCFI